MKRFLLLLAFYPSFALAESCPAHFLNDMEPLAGRPTVTLCQKAYAVGFSKKMKEPLWSAEHLTRTSIIEAQAFRIHEGFHKNIKISSGEQAMPADYKKSRWGRGRMASSGDMPSKSSRWESFAFTNIVPQDPSMISRTWNKIEFRVRREAKQNGDVYVVTGPAFLENKGAIGGAKLKIPSHLWKAVYDVNQGNGWSILCENNAASKCRKMPIFELEKKIGVRIFG